MKGNGKQEWYQDEITTIALQAYFLTRELARTNLQTAKAVTGLSKDQLELIAGLSCDDICALSASTRTLNCKFDTAMVEDLLQGKIDFSTLKVLAFARPINTLIANTQFPSSPTRKAAAR
jgi:hypothetical protein